MRVSLLLVAAVLLSPQLARAGHHRTIRLEKSYRNTCDFLLISPDKKYVALSRGDLFCVYDFATGAPVLQEKNAHYFAGVFTQDSAKLFLMAPRDEAIYLLPSGEKVPTLAGPWGITGLRLKHADGKTIVEGAIPDSPNDGIVPPGSEIVAVEDDGEFEDALSMPFRDIQSRIDGQFPVGSTLRLKVVPFGKVRAVEVTIRRFLVSREGEELVCQDTLPQRTAGSVLWCHRNNFHELRRADDGTVACGFRNQHVHKRLGTPVVSPDGKLFAFLTTYVDKPVHIEPRQVERNSAPKYGGAGTSVVCHASNSCASGSRVSGDYGVEIREATTGKFLNTFAIDVEAVDRNVFVGSEFINDNRYLVIGTKSKVHIYRVNDGKKIRTYSFRQYGYRSVNAMAVATKAKVLAVGGGGGIVRLVNLVDGEKLDKVTGNDERIQDMAISSDGTQLAYLEPTGLHFVDISDGLLE